MENENVCSWNVKRMPNGGWERRSHCSKNIFVLWLNFHSVTYMCVCVFIFRSERESKQMMYKITISNKRDRESERDKGKKEFPYTIQDLFDCLLFFLQWYVEVTIEIDVANNRIARRVNMSTFIMVNLNKHTHTHIHTHPLEYSSFLPFRFNSFPFRLTVIRILATI